MKIQSEIPAKADRQSLLLYGHWKHSSAYWERYNLYYCMGTGNIPAPTGETGNLILENGFTNFEFQVVLNSSTSGPNDKFYDFVVSLKSNGQKYKQKSGYHLYSVEENQYFGKKIDPQVYYKIFNKILADLQSPYRLHQVEAYRGDYIDEKVFGIIALTKEQAELLHSSGVYFTPSFENFKNKLTSRKIVQAIEEYRKIGLLFHLSIEQIERAKVKVSEQENNNLNDVLMVFPNTTYMFDTELGNIEDPYAELIREFKTISHDEFNPTDISDDFDIEKKKEVIVKFKINTKTYSKKLKIVDDWIDSEFFSFINTVVKRQNLQGQFYELYTEGQEVNIIYLTMEQYDYLIENKLLVFGDDWQTEIE